MGDQRYIEIPGTRTHELPPLLVHTSLEPGCPEPPVQLDSVMVEAEDMLAPSDAAEEVLEQRKFDLALQLTERYQAVLSRWCWGDSVLEWIRQCEITFEHEDELRALLHPDVWPHASRASFVTLLREKDVRTNGVSLEKAVGLRLIFREPSPIRCFSSHFLFYLHSVVADSAYRSWSQPEAAVLPPERFHFEIVETGI